MAASSRAQALVDLYAKHPLREETILGRIEQQRGTLDGITELDLAHDSVTEITDQNHVGGVASVVGLAVRAGIDSRTRVLDIGAGLGGSARCLAALFGARVDGVELSPLRSADADRLTRRVQLEDLVSIVCGDAMAMDFPAHKYDVVWGQGAWMHIADTPLLMRRVAGALVEGGRVAFEEARLAGTPRSEAEAETVAALERLWGGRFLTRDVWMTAMTAAGFERISVDDLTPDFVAHFERLTAIAQSTGAALYPAHETAAFGRAIALANSGVIAYSRFVGHRSALP